MTLPFQPSVNSTVRYIPLCSQNVQPSSSVGAERRKLEVPDKHAKRTEVHPTYHLFRLRVKHGQISDACDLAVGERLVQIVSNQELGGEDHVDDDAGELEDDATYRVYGLAPTLYPDDRDKNKGRSILTECDMST
jgi:hypothetical protein